MRKSGGGCDVVDFYHIELTYDLNSNITTIRDHVHDQFNATFTMDNLDRLIDAVHGPHGSVDGDDPWYHFVCYDECWRIAAVYRADTTTGDLEDDPKEELIYPATNLVDIAGVV